MEATLFKNFTNKLSRNINSLLPASLVNVVGYWYQYCCGLLFRHKISDWHYHKPCNSPQYFLHSTCSVDLIKILNSLKNEK